MHPSLLDTLETDFGTAILAELVGQPLTRNRQPVRLVDQTRHSSEFYFRADKRGKPYIQDFRLDKRYYPLTAYCLVYELDFNTAQLALCQQYGLATGDLVPTPRQRPRQPAKDKGLPDLVDYIPTAAYEPCRTQFERNGLYAYLTYWLSPATADALFSLYRLGTSRHWRYRGYLSTCLPQFDQGGNLRQVKVIPFDAMSGRRVKKSWPADRWNPRRNQYEPDEQEKVWFAGRSLVGRPDAQLQQCLFGEHLLGEYPDKKVALVEGESTAIMSSAHWPEYLWLATGGSNGAKWYTVDQFRVLRGRNVVLWPDNDAYDDWVAKAGPLRWLTHSLVVTDCVKRQAPAGMVKADLRDLLARPRYIPPGGSPVYGEALPVEPSEDYPPDWD